MKERKALGLKSQSAIEFLTTYGYIFLIIAVVFSVLFLYFSIPKTTIPLQCNFYSGFTCTDSQLFSKSGGVGSTFFLVAVDSEPGVVNTLSFNAVVNYKTSTIGYCLPKLVTEGQYIYCVANFTFTPNITQTYYGTYSLYAQYCPGGPGNVSSTYCTASSNYIYSGSVRLQPTPYASETLNSLIANSPDIIYSIPITIINTQTTSTPTPYQQFMWFPTSVYKTYINSKFSNVDFTTLPGGKGEAFQAWIEAGNANTVTNTPIWINIPTGISAGTNTIIYANFFSLGTNLLTSGGPIGESGELSSTYGQYDNGGYVFDFYDDFSSRDSYWTEGGATSLGGETVSMGSGADPTLAITYNPDLINTGDLISVSVQGSDTSNLIINNVQVASNLAPGGITYPFAPTSAGTYTVTAWDTMVGHVQSTTQTLTVNVVGVSFSSGLTLNPQSKATNVVSTITESTLDRMLDIDWTAVAPASSSMDMGINANGAPTANALYWISASAGQHYVTANSVGSSSGSTASKSGEYIFSVDTNGTYANSQEETPGNELSGSGQSLNTNPYSGYANVIWFVNNAGGVSSGSNMIIKWIRIRNVLPNNAILPVIYSSTVSSFT